MSALRTAIAVVWGVFWLGWLVSAFGAKRGSRTVRARLAGLLIAAATVALVRAARTERLAVHSPALEAVGVALLLSGLGVAVWARVCLGRNWAMPMTRVDEPELVTSGPYRLVRHPIYSGILLAMLGTALATELYLLIVAAAMAVMFSYSARVEERMLRGELDGAYERYRARTKMLIPFVL